MAGGDGGGVQLPTIEEIASIGVNTFSAGLVGYEDGQFGPGGLTRAIDEGIGEVTGRNMAREQAGLAAEQLRNARSQEEADRAYNLRRREQTDRNISNRIAARNTRSAGAVTAPLGRPDEIEAQLSTDYLGL